jgi:hypothetical protein
MTTGLRVGTRCYSVFNLTILSLMIGRESDYLNLKNNLLTVDPAKFRARGDVPAKDQDNDNVLHCQSCARASRR